MKTLKNMTSRLLVALMVLATLAVPAAAATTMLISNSGITDESTTLPIVLTMTNDGSTAATDTLTVTVTDTDGLITGTAGSSTVVYTRAVSVAASSTGTETINVALAGGQTAGTAYTVGVSVAVSGTGDFSAQSATLEVTPSDASPTELANGLIEDVDFENDYAPGDSVTVEINLDNAISSSDYTDVTVEAWITDGNSQRVGDRETSDEFNLNADEEEALTFSFDLPNDAAEGTYTVHLTVDSDAGQLDLDNSNTFDVERAEHSLYFESVAFDSSASAGDSINFAVELYNNGLNDEDDVRTSITVSGVGVSQTSDYYPVEEDDDAVRYFTLGLPSTMSSGEYQVTLRAWNSDVDVSETREIVVSGAAAPAADEAEEEAPSVITTTVVSQADDSLAGLSTQQWAVAALLVLLVLWHVRGRPAPAKRTRRGRKKKDVYY